MVKRILHRLSRREREALEAVYRLGEATARQIQDELDTPPSYSAVRTHLRILEEKGYLRHREEGRSYVYSPTVEKEEARRSALRNLLDTFFDGSVTATVAALLDQDDLELSPEELERLEALVRRARDQGDS